uniref:Uncharacterized protein n=1 Tax=Anopheles dirus TaxID=7168 RepID=A0A182NSS0_9DIPT
MSEDESWSVSCIETPDWMPSPEELETAYAALEKGTYNLELNWKCPGRRAPSPAKKDEPKVAEVIDKETAAKNKEFEFMDDVALPQMRVRGQTSGPKGSAKKKTTNFAGVLDHMKKHGRLTQDQKRPMDWGERTIVDDQQSVDGLRPDMRHDQQPAHQQQHLLQQPLQQPLLQPVQQLHPYMPQSTAPSQHPTPHHSPLSLAIPISDALRHRTGEVGVKCSSRF